MLMECGVIIAIKAQYDEQIKGDFKGSINIKKRNRFIKISESLQTVIDAMQTDWKEY